MDLDPSFAEAHHLSGLFLGLQGRLYEALAAFRTALQLDPLSLVKTWDDAVMHAVGIFSRTLNTLHGT